MTRNEASSAKAHPTARLQPFSVVLSDYDYALARLVDWGLRVNPASRLAAYRRQLSEFSERDPPLANLQHLERLPFVFSEVAEIVEIVRAIRLPSRRTLERLKRVVKGGIHPDDKSSASGREAQYELWLHAFLRGQCIACELADPDVRIEWRGQTIPIEAKRPGSWDSVDDRYRKAVRQLDPYDSGGIVALSLDALLRPHGQVLYADTPLEAAKLTDIAFLKALKDLFSGGSPLTQRGSRRNVIAVLVTGKLPAFTYESGTCVVEARQELFEVRGDPRRGKLTGLRSLISSYVPATEQGRDGADRGY